MRAYLMTPPLSPAEPETVAYVAPNPATVPGHVPDRDPRRSAPDALVTRRTGSVASEMAALPVGRGGYLVLSLVRGWHAFPHSGP